MMKKSKNIRKWSVAITILAVVGQSCLDPYNPPAVQAPNNYLVVEGVLNDQESSVRVSRTRNLTAEEDLVEVGARVLVEAENGGAVYELASDGEGTFTGQTPLTINEFYRVRILTSDDKEYLSEYVPILPTPDIDSVGFDAIDGGIQVHVSTNDPQNNTRYYRWDYVETWQYSSNYTSLVKWVDGEMLDRDFRTDQIFYCWRTIPSTRVLVGSTVRLAEDRIFKAPLTFLDPLADTRLSIRYSILVKQYALTQEAFDFWELIKKNSENLGTFFDPQPSQLTTNITCTNDPEEPVVGFISGAEVKEERFFIQRVDVPYPVNFGRSGACVLDTISLDIEELESAFGSGLLLPVAPVYGMIDIIGYEGSAPSCVDCRLKGGTNVRPDFW